MEGVYEVVNLEIDICWFDMGLQEVYDCICLECVNLQVIVWFGGLVVLFLCVVEEGLLWIFVLLWSGVVEDQVKDLEGCFIVFYCMLLFFVFNCEVVLVEEVFIDWDDLFDEWWVGEVIICDLFVSGMMCMIFGGVFVCVVIVEGSEEVGWSFLCLFDFQIKEYVYSLVLLYEKFIC